ncbi:MAG: HAD family hydrolase [Planctomycetaceae bacterium]|nr:HAD family hydrolase [Planctomycetaceae bacterium]
MRQYDAYLFDADGTLLDSREIIQQSFNHAIAAMGAVHPGRDYIGSTIGLPMVKQIRLVLGEGRDDSFYSQAMDIYSTHMLENYHNHLTAFPGVKEGLAALHDMGKKLAVVTSRRRPGLERFLAYLGLADFFDLLVTPESTELHKPDPAPALFAAEGLGVQPDKCVFIGDATFDIECGHAAGMDTVLVSWGGMDPSEWPVQPDLTVHTFAELLPS